MSVVQTSSGKVEGFERLDCLQFRGIPFATPPVGGLRWRSPQPAASWDGVRDATKFGPICPQNAGGLGSPRDGGHPMDEDCLTLNVYTPSLDGPHPVMVWIHGGGFANGSGRIPWYSGHTFARDGVVVVTINYRVNAFGCLRFNELFDGMEQSGTLGIQDQILALEWVRDNIANFGGATSNVTIFGESAGGMSVGTLLASPKARGLFHKAIPQSGAAHTTHTPDNATLVAKKFLELVGVKTGDTDALYALTADQIVSGAERLGVAVATAAAEGFSGSGLPFQPAVGDDAVPVPPIDALRSGAAADLPVLVGTNRDEWNLFAAGPRENDAVERAQRPLQKLFERAGHPMDEVTELYRKSLGEPSDVQVRNALETDRTFRIPAIRLAEAQVANGAPTWMYRFDWPTPAFDGRLGACHILEIPFMFDNLDAPGANFYTGGVAPQDLATTMHAAWVAFATSGDPGWTPYDAQRRPTMVFNETSVVEDDPDGDTRLLWEGVL